MIRAACTVTEDPEGMSQKAASRGSLSRMKPSYPRTLGWFAEGILVSAMVFLAGSFALCQEPPRKVSEAAGAIGGAEEGTPPPSAQTHTSAKTGLLELIWASGWVGFVIIFLSIAAVALSVEHVMTLRASVLMPPGLAEQVRELLSLGKIPHALELCRQQPSFLASVLEAGLAEADAGWPAVEKALEESLAEQSAALSRKIEYLSVIGNLAPMLGLLGTVIGMVMAFREVAATQGAARAADLAAGIYLALVTTVEGLIVAIPSLAVFAFLRNRLDQLVAATARVAEHVFSPLKRRRTSGRPVPPPPPVGGSV